MNPKPLFANLNVYWFWETAGGRHPTEYRPYGPRWNERTVWPGRRAVITMAFRWPRLFTSVESFAILDEPPDQKAWDSVYPDKKGCKIMAITWAKLLFIDGPHIPVDYL